MGFIDLQIILSVCFVYLLEIIHFFKESIKWTLNVILFGKHSPAGLGNNMFHEGWVKVNNVPSHVLTWGGWIDGPLTEGDSIIIFMCGVPGITLFYQEFLRTLYDEMKIPVWTICIAGHELPPPSSSLGNMPIDPKLYNNVEAQIAHKMAFIKNYVPKERKIYFIGHSFGAKMVTEVLKDEEVSCQTQKCLLLMPTLESFSEAPRAKFWVMMTNTGLIYSLVLWAWILSCLPELCRRGFSQLYFLMRGLNNVHSCCHDAMTHLCHPTVFNNVRALVWNELEAVKDLDLEVLTSLTDRIKVYFAPDDNWATLSHCDRLKKAVPELTVEMLDNKFIHAFTLRNTGDMADIVLKDLKTAH